MLIPEKNSRKILEALKQVVRQKGLKYSDLAEKLNVSLPTIKRRLNSANISLLEINEICEELDIHLDDLLTFSRSAESRVYCFEPAQEIFLSKNPCHLAYFYELKNGCTPLVIESRHKISKSSTKRYLKDLQQIGLIHILDANSVKILIRGPIIWDDHGPLGKVFSKAMLRGLSERTLNWIGNPSESYLALWGRALTNEDYENLQQDLKALGDKYRRLSDYNQRILPKAQCRHLSVAIMADFWDAEVFSKISDLTT